MVSCIGLGIVPRLPVSTGLRILVLDLTCDPADQREHGLWLLVWDLTVSTGLFNILNLYYHNNNNNTRFILPGLARKLCWLKPELIEGPLHGRHCQILINAFLVRNRAISPFLKTPHTLRRPLPGIEPPTYRSLWNFEWCQRFPLFGGHRGGYLTFEPAHQLHQACSS